MKTPTDPKTDIRLRERCLRNGALSKQDIQAQLKALPDESKNAQEITVYEEPTESSDETVEEPTFAAVSEG